MVILTKKFIHIYFQNDLSLLELFEDVIKKQSFNEKLLVNFMFHILLSVLKKQDLDLADM